MIDRNRNVIIKFEDREVGFRIDNWVLMQTQKKSGCKGIMELLKKIGIDDSNMDLETFTMLVCEAHNEYVHTTGKGDQIDTRKASELIDEMGGVIAALQQLADGFQSHVPKNSPPPMEGAISQ